jgi:hypothetical protein
VIEPETNTQDFAVHWASQLGANPISIERLKGGINNRVFRCGNRYQHWVIKGYAPAQRGQRDRMQAEVEFLRFAAQAAPGFTPALIQVDQERRCVVLENLEGETFQEGIAASDEAVSEAVQFFRQLNADTQMAQGFIQLDAAEGFLSLREHLYNIRNRYERMSYICLDPELRPKAESLLDKLNRELNRTEDRTNRLIDQGIVEDTIGPEERCVSPSDFGFHNAIRTSTGIQFIDFEFAGWDDPAKAVLDFILQPRVPLAKDPSPLLMALPRKHHRSVYRRCKAMGPILKLKWICILLAVLQPARLEEILLVTPEQTSKSLILSRLEKADHYFRIIR